MGIGTAYLGMGLAQGTDNAFTTQRMLEDRQRAQALQDQELQAWQEDRANKVKQQGFENDLQTRMANRADTAAGDTHALSAHTLARAPIEDAHQDTSFGMNQQLTQGKIDALPLERAELRARIAMAGSEQERNALQNQLTQTQIAGAHIDFAKKAGIADAEGAIAKSGASGDPAPLDAWANAHLPQGQSVQTIAGKDGTFTTLHYADASGPPDADGNQPKQVVNTRKFNNLDDMTEEVQNLAHGDDLYHSQLMGQKTLHYTQARGVGDIPLSLNTKTGVYYDADGKVYKGKLAPNSAGVEAGMLAPGGAGMGNAPPNPGSSYINSVVSPQPVNPQSAVTQSQPNVGGYLDQYMGDGNSGNQ